MRGETDMLVDLAVKGKGALVVGGDDEAEFKALKLLDGEARVTVVADSFTTTLRTLGSSKKLRLVKAPKTEEGIAAAMSKMDPYVVFVSTGDPALDEKVATLAKSRGAIVCVVDTPRLNDINMPAVAMLGDIRVAISTGGMSPAMASVIRKRVEELITPEDILQVRLQGHIRQEAKKHLKDAASRRRFVYSVIEDERVKSLLRKDRYREAEALAMKMLLEASYMDR